MRHGGGGHTHCLHHSRRRQLSSQTAGWCHATWAGRRDGGRRLMGQRKC